MLIADEVQTGFGRTGKMFAMEHYDVEPDLICVAKSLAGGFPLSGVIGSAPIMDAAEPGGLGGTYAGNPLACAAALAVLDVFEEERLLERSQAIGAPAQGRLDVLQTRNDLLPIRAIRGPGAMVAFDIVKDRGGDEPDPVATKRVVQRAYESGLILLSCGTSANTIRILVPLTAEDAIVDEGLDVLEQALQPVLMGAGAGLRTFSEPPTQFMTARSDDARERTRPGPEGFSAAHRQGLRGRRVGGVGERQDVHRHRSLRRRADRRRCRRSMLRPPAGPSMRRPRCRRTGPSARPRSAAAS